jgi:uncharacterized membrane protein
VHHERFVISGSVAFFFIVFKEKLSKKAMLGLARVVTGTLLMAFFN